MHFTRTNVNKDNKPNHITGIKINRASHVIIFFAFKWFFKVCYWLVYYHQIVNRNWNLIANSSTFIVMPVELLCYFLLVYLDELLVMLQNSSLLDTKLHYEPTNSPWIRYHYHHKTKPSKPGIYHPAHTPTRATEENEYVMLTWDITDIWIHYDLFHPDIAETCMTNCHCYNIHPYLSMIGFIVHIIYAHCFKARAGFQIGLKQCVPIFSLRLLICFSKLNLWIFRIDKPAV